MLQMFAAIAGTVYVAAKVVNFLCDRLSESERRKQESMRSDYESYRRAREADLHGIDADRDFRLGQLGAYAMSERQRLQAEHRARFQELNRQYFDAALARLLEHRQAREELMKEIQESIEQSKRVKREGQNTVLRDQSLEQLRQNLEEAYEKVKAYLIYLQKYEKDLLRRYERAQELPEPFDYLLPKGFPYRGQLLFFPKKDVQEQGAWEVAQHISLNYVCRDLDEVDDFDDEALLPLFVEEYDLKQFAYVVSCAKGIFKHTALYQAGVGFEATVARHGSDNRLQLDYRGLTLELHRNHLENPRRLPPRGSKLRVFPLRWPYRLQYAPRVTERYQESFALHHFQNIPLVFDEGQFAEFSERLDKLQLWESSDEWKIGPLDEGTIPDVYRLKLQLGTDLLVEGTVETDERNRSYIRYAGLLDMSEVCKPDDVFVVTSATMKVLWYEDMQLIEPDDYQTMNQCCLFLFNEFKLQKAIKDSQDGIAYFNKWAAVTDDLITYLYKGDCLYCETDAVRPFGSDAKMGVNLFVAGVQNVDEVEAFLRKTQQAGFGRADYFIETKDGRYLPVEFKASGDAFRILGDIEESEGETLTIYHKQFPYPEIQQKYALNVFREGRLANARLKPFFLNSQHIEASPSPLEIDEFYNAGIESNPFQKDAVERALGEENFFMIQGPPGTGKTTVIKEIILQHLRHHPTDRILVVSQANVAVDNVLKDLYVDYRDLFGERDLIRCGKNDKIDEEVWPISFEHKYEEYLRKLEQIPETVENSRFLRQWKKIALRTPQGRTNSDIGELILKGHRIVGATCVGLAQKNIGLDRLVFDLVIIDEGSKALPAEILIPVNRAKKVLLIGDHKQLPPTVNSALFDPEKIDLDDREYVEEEMFSKSLFQRLYEQCPDSNKRMLRTQYRMPAVLGSLVSALFYEGKLENGASTYQKEPVFFPEHLNWLDMSADRTYREEKAGGVALVNRREAELVVQTVLQMRKRLPASKRIAVITPYKGQRREIIRRFQQRGIKPFDLNVAINTIDAFQGDEAEAVIYCTTRSQLPTRFFSDEARLNVALSRAKADLLIIGSIRYFDRYGSDSPLARIAAYIREHGQIWQAEELLQLHPVF